MPKITKKAVKKKSKDFTTSFTGDQTPKEAFDAINNVRGWWSEGVKGGTKRVGEEFVFRYKDLHYSKHKLTKVVPNKKVVWLTTDAKLNFTKDKAEWKGTKIIFDITPKGKKTEVRFTQKGLVPEVECYDACSKGWTYYVQESLKKLIETGKGKTES